MAWWRCSISLQKAETRWEINTKYTLNEKFTEKIIWKSDSEEAGVEVFEYANG